MSTDPAQPHPPCCRPVTQPRGPPSLGQRRVWPAYAQDAPRPHPTHPVGSIHARDKGGSSLRWRAQVCGRPLWVGTDGGFRLVCSDLGLDGGPWGRGWGSWWDRTGWRRQLRGPAAPPQLCRWPDLTGQGDATLDKGSVLATSSNGSIGHPGTAHSCTPAWRHDGRDTGRDAATHVQPGCSRPGLKEPLACPSSR